MIRNFIDWSFIHLIGRSTNDIKYSLYYSLSRKKFYFQVFIIIKCLHL